MNPFQGFEQDDEDSPLDFLHATLEDSIFEAVEFNILDEARPDILVIEADLGLNTYTLWRGPKTAKAAKTAEHGTWANIDGIIHSLDPYVDDMGLGRGAFPYEKWPEIVGSLSLLHQIYETIEPFFQDQLSDARIAILTALDGIAEHALNVRDELDEDDDREPWELALDSFTRQCRDGMFAGVSVDESPEVPGALNISAAVIDHVLHRPVKLKVYFRPAAAEDQEEPDHWMAVDDIEVLAHSVDDDQRAGLLTGFPQESREFLLHAVDHLHAMVHSAVDVVVARSVAPYEAAEQMEDSGLPPQGPEFEGLVEDLSASAAADALAALNGVARLYTGTLPPGF